MNGYNTKNFTAQGGSVTVIGGELRIAGKLTIEPDAEVIGLGVSPFEDVEVATLMPTPYVPDSTASSVAQLRADYNLLLANLRAAGVFCDEEAEAAVGDPPDSAGEPDTSDEPDPAGDSDKADESIPAGDNEGDAP